MMDSFVERVCYHAIPFSYSCYYRCCTTEHRVLGLEMISCICMSLAPQYYRRYGHFVYTTVLTMTTPQVHFGNDALYYMEYT